MTLTKTILAELQRQEIQVIREILKRSKCSLLLIYGEVLRHPMPHHQG